MAGPTIRERLHYMCTSDVCRELGIGREMLFRRLKQEVLPPPTLVNEHGTRLFDDKWLEEARKIIELERKRNERRKKARNPGAS